MSCVLADRVFRLDFGLTQDAEGDRRIKHYYLQESVGIATAFLLAALHMSGLATLRTRRVPWVSSAHNELRFVLITVGCPSADGTVPAISKKALGEVMEVR